MAKLRCSDYGFECDFISEGEIEEVIEVQAANFDLVVKARFGTLKKLSEFIEKLRYVEGIEETSSAIITEEAVLLPSR